MFAKQKYNMTTAHVLLPLPGTTCPAVQSLTVMAERLSPTQIQLTYRVQGSIANIKWPPRAAQPGPTENLWQHTCFELFVGSADSPAYHEYNFSPSLAWDHYHFAAYRQRVDTPKTTPRLHILNQTDDVFELQAIVTLPNDRNMIGGLCAVIETTDGTLTYWALTHPAAQPDFHHAGAFAAYL